MPRGKGGERVVLAWELWVGLKLPLCKLFPPKLFDRNRFYAAEKVAYFPHMQPPKFRIMWIFRICMETLEIDLCGLKPVVL